MQKLQQQSQGLNHQQLQRKIEAITADHVIQNVILPAVNEILQYTLNEPDKAREAVKKFMDNELFRKHYWTNDDEEDSNNESLMNKKKKDLGS